MEMPRGPLYVLLLLGAKVPSLTLLFILLLGQK
jgi:hypothetical protein